MEEVPVVERPLVYVFQDETLVCDEGWTRHTVWALSGVQHRHPTTEGAAYTAVGGGAHCLRVSQQLLHTFLGAGAVQTDSPLLLAAKFIPKEGAALDEVVGLAVPGVRVLSTGFVLIAAPAASP